MFELQNVEDFLQNSNVSAPYSIWYTTLNMNEYQIFRVSPNSEEYTNIQMYIPAEKSLYNQPTYQYYKNNSTYIALEYPENYQFLLIVYDTVNLSQNDLNHLYYLFYPYYTEQLVSYEKNKLQKLINSIADTTSTLDLDEIFSNILSNALEVIPNADIGSLWLYDPKKGKLRCTAFVGDVLEGVLDVYVEVGEGPIGYTFQMQYPLLFKKTSEMLKVGHRRTSPDKYYIKNKNNIFNNKLKSSMTCPVVVDNQTKCVMFLAQVNENGNLNKHDLHLLNGFASQAAIAIKNAEQFKDINKLYDALVKRDRIHNTLMNVTLQNMDSGKIIQEIERMVKRKIIFYDLITNKVIPKVKNSSRQLSYQNLIRLTSKESSKNYYDIVENGRLTHYIFPIRSRNITLACLIIETDEPINHVDLTAIEQGSAILALELISKQSIIEYYYKNKRELFKGLLKVRDNIELEKKIELLGIDKSEHLSVIIFNVSGHQDYQALEVNIHRLITFLKTELSSKIQVIYGEENKVVSLADVGLGNHLKAFVNQMNLLIKKWSNMTGLILNAGMGSVCNSFYSIDKSYREAKAALSYQTMRKYEGLIKYSDIGVNRLFVSQNINDINEFVNEIFSPLNEYDDHEGSLENTLLYYFKYNRSATETAKKLYIHINTLYQRLRKIEELLNISFKSSDDVLRLQLGCYLKETIISHTV